MGGSEDDVRTPGHPRRGRSCISSSSRGTACALVRLVGTQFDLIMFQGFFDQPRPPLARTLRLGERFFSNPAGSGVTGWPVNSPNPPSPPWPEASTCTNRARRGENYWGNWRVDGRRRWYCPTPVFLQARRLQFFFRKSPLVGYRKKKNFWSLPPGVPPPALDRLLSASTWLLLLNRERSLRKRPRARPPSSGTALCFVGVEVRSPGIRASRAI